MSTPIYRGKYKEKVASEHHSCRLDGSGLSMTMGPIGMGPLCTQSIILTVLLEYYIESIILHVCIEDMTFCLSYNK